MELRLPLCVRMLPTSLPPTPCHARTPTLSTVRMLRGNTMTLPAVMLIVNTELCSWLLRTTFCRLYQAL